MQRNPHNDRWVQHTHTALKSLNTEIIWHGVLLIDAPDIGGVFTGISLIVLLFEVTVIYIIHLSLGKGRSTSRKHAEEVRCAFKSLWTRCDVQHVHSFFYKAGEKQFSTSSAEGKKPTTLQSSTEDHQSDLKVSHFSPVVSQMFLLHLFYWFNFWAYNKYTLFFSCT